MWWHRNEGKLKSVHLATNVGLLYGVDLLDFVLDVGHETGES